MVNNVDPDRHKTSEGKVTIPIEPQPFRLAGPPANTEFLPPSPELFRDPFHPDLDVPIPHQGGGIDMNECLNITTKEHRQPQTTVQIPLQATAPLPVTENNSGQFNYWSYPFYEPYTPTSTSSYDIRLSADTGSGGWFTITTSATASSSNVDHHFTLNTPQGIVFNPNEGKVFTTPGIMTWFNSAIVTAPSESTIVEWGHELLHTPNIQWHTTRYLEERDHAGLSKIPKKAFEKAEKLVKEWLSPMEYNYLKEYDELEIPSQYEKDVIYIVKRDPLDRVRRMVNNIVKEELCIMPLDTNFAPDDNFLTKILLLKSDEEEFLRRSNRYPVKSYHLKPSVRKIRGRDSLRMAIAPRLPHQEV